VEDAHLKPFIFKLAATATLFAGLLALSPRPLEAQYTDRKALEDLGGPQEFARRRAELAKQTKTGITLLFARNEIPEATHYREDNDFYYFTGLQEPGAVLAIDNAAGTTILFDPQQAGRTAQVYGANLLSLPKEEAAKLGFPQVLPIGALDQWLSARLSGHGEEGLWVRLDFPDKADGARSEIGRDHAWKFAHPYHEEIPQDLAPARLLAERYPMAKLHDVTAFIDQMRNIKTPQEIEVLRKNGKISAAGDLEAIEHAHPGMYQYEIEARAYAYFYSHGAQGMAYPAIVGSGKDINTWHYFSNREQIQSNELVVFDFGASIDHLTMDITRTFNISGKFTPEQAKWYAVDLECQKAVIALLKPGHTYEEAEAAGKAVFEKAGIGDQWYGFPGHFVGLATHDVLHASGPIKPGQVITVEPIVEFQDRRMHFRVEDTILITNGEPENLSASIPKEMADVEKLVGSSSSEK
jgi:Xaa-Pro aminopeptidase